jgi:actin-like ATPase involved in cell morphogenesis
VDGSDPQTVPGSDGAYRPVGLGTLLRGFGELVASETGIPVFLARSPLTRVVSSSGQALDHFDQLRQSSR